MYQKHQDKSKKKILSRWYIILPALLLGISVLTIFVVASWSPLYAFFSDKLGGSTTITASNMGVEVTKVKVQTLTYGQGKEKVYSGEIRDALKVASENSVATLADGYIVPFWFELQNTSDVTADLYPQIAFSWSSWGEAKQENPLEHGDLYIYKSEASDDDILLDNDTAKDNLIGRLTPSNNTYILPAFEAVDAKAVVESQESERYKLYYKRRDGVDRTEEFGNLRITVSAKAVLPGKDVQSEWCATVEKAPFIVFTNLFPLPQITKKSLKSDNKDQTGNSVTLSCSGGTLSGATWVKTPPYSYEIYRSQIKDENLGTFVGDTGNSGEYEDAFEYSGIPWEESYYYTTVALDDYGNEICQSKASDDVCDGGLVEVPDDILRPLLKAATSTDVMTVNNMITTKSDLSYKCTASDSEDVKISDLKGLQFLKREFSWQALNLYLDNNNFTTIMGKLPSSAGSKTYQLSLSGNPIENINEELEVLEDYKDSMQNLYLSNLNITSLDKLPEFAKLTELGLSMNNLTDVSKLNAIVSLQEINLADNKSLAQITGQLGWSNGISDYQLPSLKYLNLNGCSALNDASKAYIKDAGEFANTGQISYPLTDADESPYVNWNKTINFPVACRVHMGDRYLGINRATGTLAETASAPDTNASQESSEPPENSLPEETHSEVPEGSESESSGDDPPESSGNSEGSENSETPSSSSGGGHYGGTESPLGSEDSS